MKDVEELRGDPSRAPSAGGAAWAFPGGRPPSLPMGEQTLLNGFQWFSMVFSRISRVWDGFEWFVLRISVQVDDFHWFFLRILEISTISPGFS